MARKPGGLEVLDRAKEYLSKARTVDELRQAQAVILPIEFGMSIPQTARILGVSASFSVSVANTFYQQFPRTKDVLVVLHCTILKSITRRKSITIAKKTFNSI